MKVFKSVIVLFICFISHKAAFAEELGRFFLTEKQRQQLEYLRNKAPVEEIKEQESPTEPEQEIVMEEDLEEESEFEKEPLVKEPIELKGVVYRGKSGNTAWLNEENTYEGGLAAINVSVPESQIGKDEVQIQLPDNVTEITLKVGQSWHDETATSEEVDDN